MQVGINNVNHGILISQTFWKICIHVYIHKYVCINVSFLKGMILCSIKQMLNVFRFNFLILTIQDT